MRRYLILAAIFLSANLYAEELTFVEPESVGMSGERLQKINEFVASNIETGKHAGIVTMVARHGKIVHFEAAGQLGIDNGRPMEKDTLFRLFSMTKPITSVAVMMLYEQGLFQMNEPVSKYLPELGALPVMRDGVIADVGAEMTIEQLFTHTAGLSYGFMAEDPVDRLYRQAELWSSRNLDEFVARLGTLPLRYDPGSRYYYSVAVDVLGAIVERLSGQSLDDYFRQRIFEPLGMVDTFFSVPEGKRHRFADNNIWNAEAHRIDPLPDPDDRRAYRDTTLFSGGGGLVSTAMDYMIFCEMLRRGGTFNGTRLLSPKTVEYMTIDHLPPGITHDGDGPDTLLYPGQSFGLGFAIIENPGRSQVVSSKGAYSWGGAADTKFWIDPGEDLVAILMTQLMRSPHETRYQMKVATYQALTTLNSQ